MKTKETTQKQINKIIEFRQAIYENGLGYRKDALFETMDALCLSGTISTFPLLSLSSVHRRKWHSLYKALEKGSLDEDWLSMYLAQKVPVEKITFFSLDGTAWPRPRARTMDDRQYVYHPTAAVNGGSVCIGYPYSLLDWTPEAGSSWSLSVSVKRIPSDKTACQMGVIQVKELSQNRQAVLKNGLDIVAADGKYGNASYLRPLQGQNCGLVVRLRKDRVLYREPEPPTKKKRGRPKVHGSRFAFKKPKTWNEPDETATFEHPRLGQVKLERWNNLHGKRDADVPIDVMRASIHLERDKPPTPLWLGWQSPSITPVTVTVQTIWQAYVHRWPIEPGIRFRKQRLAWTTPQFQDKETGDRWSWLVALAVWLLYLARPIVEDNPFSWQTAQDKLTPQRVQQSLPLIFAQFGTPARAPKVRGKPPGWPKGQSRRPRTRFGVVKKQPAAA